MTFHKLLGHSFLSSHFLLIVLHARLSSFYS